ncbi:MAG: DUF2190 family protein [Phycisphaerae bacterium]|nr:DUF2190 family protein [Phycisphaerae bacterium]
MSEKLNSEAQNYQEGGSLDYTPTAARTAGQIVQVGGQAGMCATAIAANVKGSLRVQGIIKGRAAAVTGNDGDLVGWDEDGDPYGDTAGLGALTTELRNADFLVGRLRKVLTATDGVAIVELNAHLKGTIKTAMVKLTAAEIKLLATTQQTLVAAPGADKINQVLGVQMILNYGSEVLAEPTAPDDLEVVYDAAGGTSIADVIGDFVIGSADAIAQPQIKNIAGAAASTMVNKAVVLDNNGTDYTGNATGDTTLTVITTYVINNARLA